MKKNDEQKVNKLKKEKVKKEKTKKIPKRDNASRKEKKIKIGNPILSQHCDAAGWGFFNPGDRCAGSWYYLLQ